MHGPPPLPPPQTRRCPVQIVGRSHRWNTGTSGVGGPVAIGITVLVYGAVGVIVKMDDVGLAMAQRPRDLSRRVGRGLVAGMPHVLDALAIIGTFAMFWVGGHIVLVGMADLGLSLPYDLVHALEAPVSGISAVGGLLGWLVNTLCSMVLGFVVGSAVLGVVSLTPLSTKGH
nr:DUF808 family protein [Brevibacterium yomogidense]